MKRPAAAPMTAVTRLISIDVLNASLYGDWNISRTLSSVHPPAGDWNAPASTEPAGAKRKRIVYAKKGSVASHAKERRLRPDETSGRSASDAALIVSCYEPIFDGHCWAMTAFAAAC